MKMKQVLAPVGVGGGGWESLSREGCKTFLPSPAVPTSCRLSPDPDSGLDGNRREGHSACSQDVQAHGGLGEGMALCWGRRGFPGEGTGSQRRDSEMFGSRTCLTRGFISSIAVTSWEQQWLTLPLSCTDGGSFIHSFIHSSVHFTGFYCALKCIGTVLDTAVISAPSGSALSFC